MTAAISYMGTYPDVRLRRLRRFSWLRDLVAEHRLASQDFIWSVFVREKSLSPEVARMPGVTRYTPEELIKALEEPVKQGLRALTVFPAVTGEQRDAEASEAFRENNLLFQTIQAVKQYYPHVGLITDVALDPFTSHGHDGLFDGHDVVNDETVDLLAALAVMQAQAGADVVAPSDMMDGRIGAIRQALDHAGYAQVALMSYSAKYTSAFYGPFRQALGSEATLGKGSKATYQMDPANGREALREVAQDLQEGADMVMVKPGLPYLDVIAQVKQTFAVPTFAFQVSGEYAMLKAAEEAGYLDGKRAFWEVMLAFKRAGADGIISYYTPQILKELADV